MVAFNHEFNKKDDGDYSEFKKLTDDYFLSHFDKEPKIPDGELPMNFSDDAMLKLLDFMENYGKQIDECENMSTQDLGDLSVKLIWSKIFGDAKAEAVFTEMLKRMGYKEEI